MEYLKKSFLIIFRIFKRLSRKGLNLIENTHDLMYKNLSNLDFIPKKYFTRLNDLELNLKTYSPFTLMTYAIILLIIFQLTKKVIRKSYNFIQNISLKKIKDFFIILILKLPKYQNEILKAKQEMKIILPKIFKNNSYKKIEFHDNKQDEYSVLQKLSQMSRVDDKIINSGKLTGAVYCGDNKIQNIAGDAAKIIFKFITCKYVLFTSFYRKSSNKNWIRFI